jgi:hypothetical protein
MATDVGIVDGQLVSAAYLNVRVPFIAGANKSGVKICYARIRYTGSVWEVSSGTDSAGIVSGNIAWSTDHINITLSGYTATPAVLATPVYTAGISRLPHGLGVSATQGQVWFVDYAGVLVTTQATTMDCYVRIEGI